MHVLGFDEEADDFARFIGDICHAHGNRLQIMYGIGGERELTETTLDHLSGYGGARPVRIGNGAFDQQPERRLRRPRRLALHPRARRPDPAAAALADRRRPGRKRGDQVWTEPDQGIWEARGPAKHYVSSKLMCWVALDRGARLAARREDSEEQPRRGGGRSPTRSSATSSSAGSPTAG